MMGYVFWYIGNGSQINIYPKSVSLFHREYFVDFRQEEITLSTGRIVFFSKAAYLRGLELVDENANVKGEYYVAFTGVNVIFTNRDISYNGWSFGIGPGFLTSKIHTYTDYAFTINGAAIGNLEGKEVLLLVENLGYGKTIPTPEIYLKGMSSFQNFRIGTFFRLFGDIDLDAGFIFDANYGVFKFIASPSIKNLVAGFSIDVGSFNFRYDYEYYWIGYTTHRLGFDIFWGRQEEMERRIKRLEKTVARHEEELGELKRKVEELENKANIYANNLYKQALNEKDPDKALLKLELALAFDTTENVKKLRDSLIKESINSKKKRYIERIENFLRNNLLSSSLAEALLMLEEFPEDEDALRIYKEVRSRVDKVRDSQKVVEMGMKEYQDEKIKIAENLIDSERYAKAAEIVNTLPYGPERINLSNKLKSIAEKLISKAKVLISQENYIEAKYYIEKSMKIYPLNEASGLLAYVQERLKGNAQVYYLKCLESYQKGDIVKAFAYIKEATTLDPTNEKYRGVYFRLKNALNED